ncbi:MAG: SDR family oxidoreductase [Anaerolineaceae bacterium]|nr:SDR family oxidoreductase [Anaerolineaceae bacterium]
MINPQLDGKTAIVTGANNPLGIGSAVAKALAAQGVRVFITYYRLPAEGAVTGDGQPGEALYRQTRAGDAREVLGAIRAAGGQAEAWEANLSEPMVIPALFDRVNALFGPVNILVNNAAHSTADTFVPTQGDLVNTTSVEWISGGVPVISPGSIDRHFAINTRAVALLMAEFARRHVGRGADWGRIINISTDGAHGFPSETSYGASKLALESYSRAAAGELGQFGITVNILSPGAIQTGWITPALEVDVKQNTPLGRVGYPEDIADAIVFLASHQGRWITGQTLRVNGGRVME